MKTEARYNDEVDAIELIISAETVCEQAMLDCLGKLGSVPEWAGVAEPSIFTRPVIRLPLQTVRKTLKTVKRIKP
jgi:hypothetical protein